MKRWSLFVFAAVVVIGVLMLGAGCGRDGRVVERYSGEMAKNMLFNRPWLDEFPEKPEQRFMVYIFTKEGLGVHDKAHSAYRHLLEIFTFRANPEKISFLFPHDNRKAESAYKVERLQGNRQFNLRVTITQDPQVDGKTYVYFSHTDWEMKDRSTLPAELRSLPDCPK
jgi:hypothetical protein